MKWFTSSGETVYKRKDEGDKISFWYSHENNTCTTQYLYFQFRDSMKFSPGHHGVQNMFWKHWCQLIGGFSPQSSMEHVSLLKHLNMSQTSSPILYFFEQNILISSIHSHTFYVFIPFPIRVILDTKFQVHCQTNRIALYIVDCTFRTW